MSWAYRLRTEHTHLPRPAAIVSSVQATPQRHCPTAGALQVIRYSSGVTVEYDAFLSYAHGSDKIAQALQEGLQRFAKPWWRRRALRVFLDRTALSANPGLWSSIAEAMDNSEWFVLVASPKAAESIWVNREVAHWLERHGSERLLVAVTGGEWSWEEGSAEAGVSGSAVPEALLGAYREEPRHVDLRWAQSEPELDLRNPRFRDQLAELAAPIRNVSKDELEGTDLREHRRFRRMAIAIAIALSVLSLASTAASIAAVSFANRAAARTADADFARLVAQSRNLRASDPSLAILLAVEATRIRDNAQSSGAVLATVSQDPRFVGNIVPKSSHRGVTSICVPGRTTTALIGGSDGSVSAIFLNGHNGAISRFHFGSAAGGPAFVSCSHNSPVAVAYDTAGYWSQVDPASGRARGAVNRDPGLHSAAVAPAGDAVALSDTGGPNQPGHLRLNSLDASGSSRSVVIPESIYHSGLGLAFSPDGSSLATVNSDRTIVWNTYDLAPIFSVPFPALAAISATPRTPLLRETNDLGDASFSPDGHLLVVSANSVLQLIDVSSHKVLWSEPTGWYGGSPVGFTDQGRLLANSSTGIVQQLDIDHGAPVNNPITPHIGVAVDFAFTGTRVVTSSISSSVVSLYDLNSEGPITRDLPLPASTSLLEYDPSGTSLLMSAGSTPTVFVTTRSFNDKTGMLGPLLPSLVQPRFIEPHVVGGIQSSLTIGELDSNSGRFVTPPYAVPVVHATNAQFDPRTHRLLLANEGGELNLYSERGAVVASPWAQLGSYPVLSSSGFAKDGSIAAFDSGDHRVWVLNNQGHVTLQKSTDVTMASLSPGGGRLAILHDLHIDLFDSHTGVQIGTYIGVPPGSTDIEWSVDGSRILAFGRDQGQLIDAVSGQPLGDPLPSSGYLALRPDGNEVATVANGSLVMWNVNLAHLEVAACQAAGRNLTQAEWGQYLPNGGSYRRVCPQWP